MTYGDFMTLFAIFFALTSFYYRRRWKQSNAHNLANIIAGAAMAIRARHTYIDGLKLARREAIHETMECARQIVKSYGPPTVAQLDRDHICGAMDHYERTAK